MPFTRITLHKGKSPDYLRSVSESLDQALTEIFDVPVNERFQAFNQLEKGELIFDRGYLGGPRSEDFILFEVATGKPRSTAAKQAFYRRLVELLARSPGIRPEDVMILVSMTGGREDWSLSSGLAWSRGAA